MAFCPALQHQCSGLQAVTDDGWQRYSLVFPKAKKGDHAIRNIITQASRGGYDIDGALEIRGCNFFAYGLTQSNN